MNVERDKFLTEATGECWHEPNGFHVDNCKHCNKWKSGTYWPDGRNNFSSWTGFGKLWEWFITWDADAQVAFIKYKYADGGKIGLAVMSGNYILTDAVNPSRFADAVFSFLRAR